MWALWVKLIDNLMKVDEMSDLDKYARFQGDCNCVTVAGGYDVDPGFSHQGCDCCNDGLGNNVEPVVGYNPKTKEVEELGDICGECLCFFANGELPE